ncbi:epg-6 [Pristionchus pacificus]|nr:epg-6 [Pristionchus pacificus]
MTIPAECNNLIKYVSYNAQQDCVAVATDSGVRVYNCNPLTEVVTLSEGQVGSIRIAQVLHRSNIIALVSGGRRPKYASNTLMLWDEARKRCVAECAVQGGPILNVFINTTRLVLVQSNRIHIFGLQPLHFLCAVDTGSNPSGLGAMGGDGPSAVLAFPSFKKGTVQLVAMDKVTPSADKKSLPPCVLTAHVGDIAVLAVNAQGTMLASGSTKGTIIRIFDTRTRLPLNELRRGTDPATLHCLAFSPCGTYLASSSDKSTVHIFNTRERNEDYGWSMRSMRNFYEEGKRSCAQFSLPDDTVAKLGFVAEEMEEGSKGTASQMSVVAVCSNGTFHRFSFNKEGLCERRAFDHILQLGSESDFWTAPF